MNLQRIIVVILFCGLMFSIYPQIFHTNKGESTSIGEYNNGTLENAYLLPRKQDNFKCYSFFSYYILDREYTHSKIYYTIISAYKDLAIKYPNRTFIYMESAGKNGGRLFPHRTHQNGLSIDFMSPLSLNNKPKQYDFLGIFRYALNFNINGNLNINKNVSIEFSIITEHILLLQKYARKNGLCIKKVIFNIQLKEHLFATQYGKKLRKSGIYFAQNLSPLLNTLHDDHYHVDFELIPQ